MSQSDYVIDNQTAPNFRADLNLALRALASTSSGATAPSTTYANMLWYDSGTNILKMRSEADDAWINLGTLDQSLNTFAPAGVPELTQVQVEDDTSTVFGQVSGQRLGQAITALSGGGVVQEFLTSGTWTKPTKGTAAFVSVWGGGGGGISFSSGNALLKGGGGGDFIRVLIPFSELPSSVTVTIGAGGLGSATTNGNSGGDSSFGDTIASGGRGGVYYPTAVSVQPKAADDVVFGEGGGGQDGLSYLSSVTAFINNAAGTQFSGAGGGSVEGWGSDSVSTGKTSVYGGNGGDGSLSGAATDGAFPAGGGGSAFPAGASGSGGDGYVTVVLI